MTVASDIVRHHTVCDQCETEQAKHAPFIRFILIKEHIYALNIYPSFRLFPSPLEAIKTAFT